MRAKYAAEQMAEGSGCVLPHASRAVSVGGSLRAMRSAAEGLIGARRRGEGRSKTHAGTETLSRVYQLLFGRGRITTVPGGVMCLHCCPARPLREIEIGHRKLMGELHKRPGYPAGRQFVGDMPRPALQRRMVSPSPTARPCRKHSLHRSHLTLRT